ncbi:hypothetical protein ARMSODRAFT_1019599 [Armillaria solidipes]|uniref:Metallo-beta-lactamase domain-containing protein n=1 Tax=Armillaria solidipes TaxID=1076256 RepID=A0A2H3BHQ6_9AGAR|nr:hypothetical protein ARMSODRAFT_1019599 [Armillaria solidipes]
MVADTVTALEGGNEGGCVDDAHPRHAQQPRPTLSGNNQDTNAWYGGGASRQDQGDVARPRFFRHQENMFFEQKRYTCKIEDEAEADEGIISRNRYEYSSILFAANLKSGSPEDTYVERGGCIDAHQGDVVTLVSSLQRARGYFGTTAISVRTPAPVTEEQSRRHGSAMLFSSSTYSTDARLPSFWARRGTQPLCKIEDIPDVNTVVISHNHYDRLDNPTLSTIFKRTCPPHIFTPLGNQKAL